MTSRRAGSMPRRHIRNAHRQIARPVLTFFYAGDSTTYRTRDSRKTTNPILPFVVLVSALGRRCFSPRRNIVRTRAAVKSQPGRDRLHRHAPRLTAARLVRRSRGRIDAPPPWADAERFAKHLANEFAAVFLFLCDPSIEATNSRAERAIRPAVVTRKVCGGNRTRKGADTQQVLASVVRTARQRKLALPDLIATMPCSPKPVVPEALALPPPPC